MRSRGRLQQLWRLVYLAGNPWNPCSGGRSFSSFKATLTRGRLLGSKVAGGKYALDEVS
jgi:hypothetical protein